MPSAFTVAYEKFLNFIEAAIRLFPNLVIGAVVLVAFFFAARLIRDVVHRSSETKRHRNLATALGRLAQWAMLLMGMLIAITIVFPNFTPADLISALGITGIAIGFAFRDIFENFLAGILILVTEPFRIGDQIIIEGYEGTVDNIETRATTIITYDGRRVVIPNAKLFKSSVTINTAFDKRRLEYDIGIGNGDDIQRAKDLMLGTVSRIDGVLADPAPDALVFAYTGTGVTIRLRWWIAPPRRADVLEAQDKVLQKVKNVLSEHGIGMPLPVAPVPAKEPADALEDDREPRRDAGPANQPKEKAVPRVSASASANRDLQGRDAPAKAPQPGRATASGE